MEPTSRPSRLEARIAPDVHALLKRAAEIEGRSLTDFVVSASLEAARRTVEQADLLRLSGESANFVAQLLAEPPAPTPAMARAIARHEKLVVRE
jgi:uncharacterized protein (DUF1778 family)